MLGLVIDDLILALLGWRLFAGLRDGETGVKVLSGRAVVRRAERPILFWLIMAAYIFFTTIFLLIVVVARFRPLTAMLQNSIRQRASPSAEFSA